MTAAEAPARRDHVQSIERGFAVLRCFGPSAPTLTLSEVAARTGLDRAAARRYLLSLQRLGYVGRDRHDRFQLRPRILELGYAYLSALSLPQVAQGAMSGLVHGLQESCALTVLDGTDITYVAVQNAARALAINLTVGNRLPAYCTAMGRVLLAGLEPSDARTLLLSSDHRRRTSTTIFDAEAVLGLVERTRRVGWCVVDQELEEGVRSVAVPVRDLGGTVVAAASVSAPSSRVTVTELRGPIRERLTDAVAEIEAHLGRGLLG